MHEVFEVDIDNYNIIQLANWIKKCRSAIKLSDKMVYEEDYSRFASAVFDFCEEWKAYIELHKDKSKSKEFLQALKLSAMPKSKYIIILSDYKEIDVTQDFEDMQLQNLISSNLICKSIDKEVNRVKTFDESLDDFISGKREALHGIMNHMSLSTFTYKINILEKESDILTKTTKQVISTVKRGKWKTVERKIEPEPSKTLSDYLITKIRENNINKNLFYTFTKNKEKNKNRVYSKSFFENVGFFLGLTIDQIERILCNEGYTIKNSNRRCDEIVAECFSYYFSQNYATALLFKEGYNTLDIGK